MHSGNTFAKRTCESTGENPPKISEQPPRHNDGHRYNRRMDPTLINRIRDLSAGTPVPADDSLRAALRDLGLSFDEQNGSIHLTDVPELLDPDTITNRVSEVTDALRHLDVHFTIGSTNTHQLARADESDFHGSVCIAERQEAGKGRRGRHWVSPFGRNIYMSTGWCIPRTQSLSGLSLAVGIAIAGALRDAGLHRVGLKWPNDLLMAGGKLGGILVEVASPTPDHHRVVIGCGINLRLDTEDAARVDRQFSTVLEHVVLSRNELVATLLGSLLPALEAFGESGFSLFHPAWHEYDVFSGAGVNVTLGDRVVTGVNAGVDDAGNLRLRTDRGIETYNAGEVSLRPSEPHHAGLRQTT